MSTTPPDSPLRRFRQRIRYRFDNLLARGTWATLIWLGAITLVAVIFSALLLAIFSATLSGSEDGSFLEDLWQSLLRVMDPGTMAGDVGWGRRILALLITVFGLLVAGTLIGIIANAVEDRVGQMRSGRSTVVESDHIVVLGDSTRLPVLLHHLAVANERKGGVVVVVLADRDPAVLGREVRHLAEGRLGSRFVFRSGDPTNVADLEMVRLDKARAVAILANEAGGDSVAMRAVMAVATMLGNVVETPVVVELQNPDLGAGLVHAFGPNVHPVAPSLAIARIAAFALRERGLGQVVASLTDLRGSDLNVLSDTGLGGRAFAEIVGMYANARPLGIMGPDGHVALNPPPDTSFSDADRLVLINESGGPLVLSSRERREHADVTPPPPRSPNPDNVLVVGWNPLGSVILAEWQSAAGPDSSAQVLFDPERVDANRLGVAGDRARPEIRFTPIGGFPAIIGSVSAEVTTVLLLGYADIDPDEADSRTLLELASLRQELARLDGKRPRVLTHLVEAENLSISGEHGTDDMVISDAMGSQLIAQLVEQPERRQVLLDLYQPGGATIRIVPASALGIGGSLLAGDLYDLAYSRGWIAVGWRYHEGGGLVLNAEESTSVTLASDDDIVLIA